MGTADGKLLFSSVFRLLMQQGNLILKITALLRCYSHTIQLTHLKWFLLYSVVFTVFTAMGNHHHSQL